MAISVMTMQIIFVIDLTILVHDYFFQWFEELTVAGVNFLN